MCEEVICLVGKMCSYLTIAVLAVKFSVIEYLLDLYVYIYYMLRFANKACTLQ